MVEVKLDIFFSALKEDKQKELLKLMEILGVDEEDITDEPISTLTIECDETDEIMNYIKEGKLEIIEKTGPEDSEFDILRASRHRGWRNGGRIRHEAWKI